MSDEEVESAQISLHDQFVVLSEPAAAAGYAAFSTGRAQVSDSENCVLIIF